MAKNKEVGSWAVQPDLHAELKRYCKRKGVSKSNFLCDLIAKALKVNVDEDPVIIGKPPGDDRIPIVLRVPPSLRGNHDGLKTWMDAQANGIVAKLSVIPPPQPVVEPAEDVDDDSEDDDGTSD